MSATVLLGVALLGGAGAVARVVLGAAVQARARSGFPWGTLAVNLTGALALGVLAGLAPGEDVRRLVGAGLLGAYTTFSTWMLETHRQAAAGRRAGAVLNVVVSLVLGLACVWAGRRLGRAL